MYKYGQKLSSSLCLPQIYGKTKGSFGLLTSTRCLQSNAPEKDANVFRKKKFKPPEPTIEVDTVLPSQTRVVICGGGIMGASVAYHLALLGWGKDTVLVEQDKLSGESPWCASGLAGRFEPSYSELKLAEYSIELIKELSEKGLPTGWRQVGSLNLARNFDRMISFNRMKSQGVAWGVQTEILTPEQCKDKCPLLEVKDLTGGLWIPDDGVCDPQLVCQSFIHEAKRMDVRVVEHCVVKKIRSDHGKVAEVETTAGNILCDYFVNCTGFWARAVGTLSSPAVKIPLKAVEHHYLHTKPIEGLNPNTPFVRDYDGGIYFREKAGTIMAGNILFCKTCSRFINLNFTFNFRRL